MQSPLKIFVVITAYNEAKYLSGFLQKLIKQTPDFIVVDDGSIDNTAEIARKFTQHLLIHPINLGKGAAMKTGADYAFNVLKADVIIYMDGDDQHHPLDLEKFYDFFISHRSNLAQNGLVFGVRAFDQNMPLYRVLGNRFASVLVNLLFGQYLLDIPSGFKAMSRSVYQQLNWQSSDYGVELEIACKTAKYKIAFSEIPIKTIYHDLDRGMSMLDTFKMIHKVILWRINL